MDATVGFRVDPAWPAERIPGDSWGGMSSIAIGPDGNVWTFSRGKAHVQVYTPEGKLVEHWGRDIVFREPHTLRFDKDGNLWASDTGTHTVRKFSLDGKTLLTLGTPNERGSDAAHFDEPTDQAFASNGDVYVTDGYGNDRVVVFEKDGRFKQVWGKLGHRPGEFSLPHSIAIDSRDRVYVADRNNARIQIFDRSGELLEVWCNIVTPWQIVINAADEICVCGSSPMLWSDTQRALSVPPKDQLFLKLTPDGRLVELWTFPKGSENPGEVNMLHTIAFGADGSLYVGDIKGKKAQKFRREGHHAR